MKYYPPFPEFERLATSANVVPVYRHVMADSLTPVVAFRKLAEQSANAFLFESVTGGEKLARYSFMGYDPFFVLKAKDRSISLLDEADNERNETGDPFDTVRSMVGRYRSAETSLPRLAGGGAVGYIGYDAVRHVEKLPDPPSDVLDLPDLYLCFYDTMLVVDHVNNAAKIVCGARIDAADLKGSYERACSRIDEMASRLTRRSPVSLPDIAIEGEPDITFSSNFEAGSFEHAVSEGKEYISAGDVIQVVLSQRLTVESAPDPFDVYRALRVVNPSPYMFHLRMGDLHLVGSSPEVMVRLENGIVTVRPIAGTRRRGRNEEEDAALAAELLADPKEIAEHAMLLDLGRNDVGRISRFGTVDVTEKMIVERYSHVMHLTSNVRGKMDRDRDAVDVLKACLPAGTVSGAPKVRAMEIIDELEPHRRGPYAGAVGYLDFAGNMDTCIAIRTLIFSGGKAHVQVGAGIVADSVPEREYSETINKAKGMLKAIQVARSISSTGPGIDSRSSPG
jgi:anthranilate synthase component 1